MSSNEHPLRKFGLEYPNPSEETLDQLLDYLKNKNKTAYLGILAYKQGDFKRALFYFKEAKSSSIDPDIQALSSLMIVRIISEKLPEDISTIKVEKLKELKNFSKYYNLMIDELKSIRGLLIIYAKEYSKDIAEKIMRESIALFNNTNNALLASFFMKYALKFAEISGDIEVIGKVKYNLSLLLIKLGRENEAKKYLSESLRTFRTLSGISEKYDEYLKKIEQTCAKLNCLD